VPFSSTSASVFEFVRRIRLVVGAARRLLCGVDVQVGAEFEGVLFEFEAFSLLSN
jgi:hypothetical protein